MSALTEIAIVLAWGMSIGSTVVHAYILIRREQPPTHRVVDLLALAMTITVFVGLWPLVWGDA